MNTAIKGFAAVGIGVAVALGSAGVASADTNSYIADLQQSGYGFTGAKGTYIAWGAAICADEANGFNRDQIVRNVINGNNLTVDAATFVVESAEIHLC